MNRGFWRYLREAFNARPIGMLVPPNWIGLAAIGMAGLLEPGFWLLGLGLELGYLFTLATNNRFQRYVHGKDLLAQRRDWESRQKSLLNQLDPADRDRHEMLTHRCQLVLSQQHQLSDFSQEHQAQSEGLGRLLWIHLKLLLARHTLQRTLQDAAPTSPEASGLDGRLKKLRHDLQQPDLSDDLRKSLQSQAEIIQQRLARQQEAREKLAYLDAELNRIQQQVELIREQAALSQDPASVSNRIDQIAATLGGTTQWINQQRQALGQVEDLLIDPPPLAPAPGPIQQSRQSVSE